MSLCQNVSAKQIGKCGLSKSRSPVAWLRRTTTRAYVINGCLTAKKAGPKTRTHAEMLALGAEYVGSFAKHKFVRIEPC